MVANPAVRAVSQGPLANLAAPLGRVAELADAQASGACVRKDVGVQVPPRPPGPGVARRRWRPGRRARHARPVSAFDDAARRVDGGADARAVAAGLVRQLTDAELLTLLDGDAPFWPGLTDMTRGGYYRHAWPAGRNERLGIPGLAFADGPRGVVVGNATCFPVAMARAATFDVDLEAEVGRVIGLEARAAGATYFGGVCVNLLRHPAWGRAQETYGEDPHLLGEMGAALDPGRAAARHGVREALRVQLDGERPVHGGRHCRRPRAPRGVPAALPARGGRGRRERDERVQRAERRVVRSVPGAADAGVARRVGIRRLRDHRLHLRAARPGRVGARRTGRGDALRPATRRRRCPRRWQPGSCAGRTWRRPLPASSRRSCASPRC